MDGMYSSAPSNGYGGQQSQAQPHASSGYQLPAPALTKRSSVSQMQGVQYHAAPGYQHSFNQSPSQAQIQARAAMSGPSSPSQFTTAAMAGNGSAMGMSLSPMLRSNSQAGPPSAYSPAAYSPGTVPPGSPFAQQQQQPNFGLGVSSAYPQHQPQEQQQQHYQQPQRQSQLYQYQPHTASLGTAPSLSADHAQRHHQYQQRPTSLLATSANASSTAAQRQFNRSNSSTSAALSVSTSPTTAGPASPMTPSSPATAFSPGATGTRATTMQQHQQRPPQQHQQQYQHSAQATTPASTSAHPPHSPALDQRWSNRQLHASHSSYTGANPAQTADQAQAHAQYAAYLDDHLQSIDRRIGSYSPSHYALGGPASTNDASSALPQQYASSSMQSLGYNANSAGMNQQQHIPMHSPRDGYSGPYLSSVTNTGIASQQQASLQFQQQPRQSTSMSPTYSKQSSNARPPSTNIGAAPPFSPFGPDRTASGHGSGLPLAATIALGASASGVSSSNQSHALGSSGALAASAGRSSYRHDRTGSHASSHHSDRGAGPSGRRRPRSAGSAFRTVRDGNDLRPGHPVTHHARRADPEGGTVSPLKALTVQLSGTYHMANPHFRYEFSLNPRRVLTKPSKPCGNNGYDNEDSDYILYVNDVLGSEGNKYLILDVLGQGTFGQVVKCQNLKTHEIVGVKVIKNKEAYAQQSMMEIMILDILNSTYDPQDKHHILRLKDNFTHQKHLCLVFELLSSNLYELIKQNSFRGLSLSLVRVFTEQLLDALCVLKDAKLIHCDLKPENILLKTLQSPDIKVIDFGSACHEKQTVYTYIQSRFYRSPEVLLGLPYSTSIDMWSLGCICVELFLGLPLFPGTSEFNQITRIVEMLGLPPHYMLESGKQVHNFLNFYFDNYGQKRWRMKTLDEYCREHPTAKEAPSKKFFNATTLPDIVQTYPNQRKGLSQADIERETQNRLSFIDFVKGLLNMNPMERWTPQQAKLHPFVQNKEFTQPFVPPMGGYAASSSYSGQSPRVKDPMPDRPYGGLPPTPARSTTQTYQDAASYQQHLNQQQAHNAMAAANAFRQSQQPTNPYAAPPHEQHSRQSKHASAYQPPKLPSVSVSVPRASGSSQHSPSQSMSMTSSTNRNPVGGPLSPNIPMNPPQAHHYPVRGRSGTFSQLDVPPALQKLGVDLSSFKAIGTPQLRRDEQRAAWERRHAGNTELDRRRSLKQSNPHLEHLEYYAQGGVPANYYYPPPNSVSQPFSVVIDPRMSDIQGNPNYPTSSAVTVPPQAYSGQNNSRYSQPALHHGNVAQPSSAGPFDQYDSRDGLNAMMHQPLLPTPAGTASYYGSGPTSYAAAPYATPPGSHDAPPSGRQKRSDQQMWP